MKLFPPDRTPRIAALLIGGILLALALALSSIAACWHCALITAGVIGAYVYLAYFWRG